MRKTVISVFGPDGAGKSTLARQVGDTLPNSITVNGSQAETWPDTSWHDKIIRDGLNPLTHDPDFHTRSIIACYSMVGRLLGNYETVIIDSDLRTKAAIKAKALYAHQMPLAAIYDQLHTLTSPLLGPSTHQASLHVTVEGETSMERAEHLMRRIDTRGEATFYDPADLAGAVALVETCDQLETILELRGDQYIRAITNNAEQPDPAYIASVLTR